MHVIGFYQNRREYAARSGLVSVLGGVREQKTLKGHLPRIHYHQVQ